MRTVLLSLAFVACDTNSATPSMNDMTMVLLPDLALNLDMTAPTACNPVDPMSDGKACVMNGCPAGQVAVSTGGGCVCWQSCEVDKPTQCPCDRRCAPLTRADMGVVGGACLLANEQGQRCGDSGGPGLNPEGCAQSLLCVNADDNGMFRYCVQDCTAGQTCPLQTSCLQLNGVTTSACAYDSANGGLPAGAACKPGDSCQTGYLCDTVCRPQCDRTGATCATGSCTALTDGTTTVGYVCK
jgi:hypothetical protein